MRQAFLGLSHPGRSVRGNIALGMRYMSIKGVGMRVFFVFLWKRVISDEMEKLD